MTGEESLEPGHIYYRAYDMKAGDKLTWEWHALAPGGNLTCSLSISGRTLDLTRGGSGSGTYLADIDRPVRLEWTNYWLNETAFHFRVDLELNPSRYIPYIYGIVLVNSICIGLIVVLRLLPDRKKA